MTTLSRVVLTRRSSAGPDSPASHGSRSWSSRARASSCPVFLLFVLALRIGLVGVSGSAGKLKRRSWELNPSKACCPKASRSPGLRQQSSHTFFSTPPGSPHIRTGDPEQELLGLLLSGDDGVCSVLRPWGEEARVPQSEPHEAQGPGACAGLCPGL